MNVLPLQKRLHVAAALVEGVSIRGTERLVGAHRDTIMRFGVSFGEGCALLHDALVRDVRASIIQVDEIWTYVGKKQKQLRPNDPSEFGDQYVFVALDAVTKLAISYRVDKRTAKATQAFMHDLRARVLGRPQITSDGFEPYVNAVEWAFGVDVDYAMLVKTYKHEPGVEAARRYSPGEVISTEKRVMTGRPDKKHISTSYIERSNLTMRMSMRRFTRLTNAFSRRLRNLEAAVALHFAHYNFCRVHETLRTTPAMAAGLTDHVWGIDELLDAAMQSIDARLAG